MLNKQKGNMFDFITHTWNGITGICPHGCSYCYMKIFKNLGELKLNRNNLKDDLGEGNYIFVGSSCDMWAKEISDKWIFEVLSKCVQYSKNKYLFQTKNPGRMYSLRQYIPHDSILGVTIETDKHYPEIMGNSPRMEDRAFFMNQLAGERGFKTMVTIEPILDFNLNELVSLIRKCKPSWVNIGADSKGHKLPEPSKDKILDLIMELEEFTEVKKKTNLKRLNSTSQTKRC